MSANSDKSQKSTFVFSNLYELYKRNQSASRATVPTSESAPAVKTPVGVSIQVKEFPQGTAIHKSLNSGRVLKTGDLHQPEQLAPQVKEYQPAQLLGKRFPKPQSIEVAVPSKTHVSNPAILSLKQNISQLSELHSRLKFMLTELEDLIKK